MSIAERRKFWKEQIRLSKTKPSKNVKPLRYPHLPEISYQHFIKRQLRKTVTEIRALIDPEISLLVKAHKQEMTIDASGDKANEIFRQAQSQLLTGIEEQRLGIDLASQAQQINYNNRLQLNRHFNQGLGIIPLAPEPWLAPLLGDFVTRNVVLIKSVEAEFIEAVRKKVVLGVTSGESVQAIKKDILKITGKSFRRAETIARTETGKMFGSLTKSRNLSIGITDFIWHHTTLKNPRQQHLANNNHKFNWIRGDINGDIPGSLYNCRCTSTSDFSQLL